MKTPRPRRLTLAATCVLLATLNARASDEALRPIAFQNGVNQQSLGAETAELARAITSLIDELQRNGFPVQSLNGLTELAAQLNSLGGTEMTAIASRLRKLGENAQADPRATATEAYVAQQAIETRLKSLARQISIQQLREEAARRLEALITRQLAIQRETRAIATAKPDAERQRLLESDQAGMGEDLATFFQTGENLLARLREKDAPATAPAAPAAPPTDTPATTPPSFAERVNGTYLNTLSTEAVDHLKGKRYPEAYGRQEYLILELRKILQGILSSIPKEQRLANALQQVSALRQQEEAREQTKTSTPETRQDAADQAQNLASQVAAVSPEAAAALQQAQQALQNPQPPSQQNQQANAQQQEPQQNGQNQPAQGQQQGQPASAALAQAQTALQNAITQAQQQNGQNQQGQQQAGNQQTGQQQGQQQGQGQQPGQQTAQGQQQGQQSGQQQAGAQQQGQGQQQPQGQGQQTAQTGQNGQPPNSNQQSGQQPGEGPGDAQNQIAGHGPEGSGPAQTVGALRREEREAFSALQGERYPAEYSAWVQQYWRNLAQEQ